MVGFGESSDHGVPNEGAWAGEAAEEEVGVVEVAAVGNGAEGDDLSGREGVGEGSGDDEMGLDLLDFSHGEKGFFQEREGSLV